MNSSILPLEFEPWLIVEICTALLGVTVACYLIVSCMRGVASESPNVTIPGATPGSAEHERMKSLIADCAALHSGRFSPTWWMPPFKGVFQTALSFEQMHRGCDNTAVRQIVRATDGGEIALDWYNISAELPDDAPIVVAFPEVGRCMPFKSFAGAMARACIATGNFRGAHVSVRYRLPASLLLCFYSSPCVCDAPFVLGIESCFHCSRLSLSPLRHSIKGLAA